jgi:HAD superfamily hydrolase (TIGR01549 family)
MCLNFRNNRMVKTVLEFTASPSLPRMAVFYAWSNICSAEWIVVQGVVFDIDGTIIDSVDLHIELWKRAFQQFGKECSYEPIRRQIGKGADEFLAMFFSREELGRVRGDLEKYRRELFKREYLPKAKAFPRVRELFERIKRDGRKIALASTAKEEEIKIYKEIARIDDLVDAVACSEDVEHSKPHRDICSAAVQKLGNIAPERVIAVGDTRFDAEAAGKIKVRTIGLLCGGGNREELHQAGCIAIYKDPADLLEQYRCSPLQ